MKTHSFTNKSEIQLKSGGCIPVGVACTIRWEKEQAFVTTGGVERRLSKWAIRKMLKLREPSMATLMKWNNDGVCKSILGNKVEPDGHDDYGAPSWMLFLGCI